jgi:hypothetical protein
VVRPVNQHDTLLFNESFFGLLETADLLEINLDGSYLTLDSGFDSQTNRVMIRGQGLIPVIKPIRYARQPEERIEQRLEEFEPYRDVYRQRITIERCFAWEDAYRRLVIRYERLQCTHQGFKYLAYSMINLRWFMGKNQGKP